MQPPPQQVAPPPMQMQQPMPGPVQGPNDDSSKIYNGTKYERKQTGPFAGKLASNGTIISIDGEDYVEYRVLTKVQFF
ncbi:tRNA splicing endonuclease subunit [Apiospora hydei]